MSLSFYSSKHPSDSLYVSCIVVNISLAIIDPRDDAGRLRSARATRRLSNYSGRRERAVAQCARAV